MRTKTSKQLQPIQTLQDAYSFPSIVIIGFAERDYSQLQTFQYVYTTSLTKISDGPKLCLTATGAKYSSHSNPIDLKVYVLTTNTYFITRQIVFLVQTKEVLVYIVFTLKTRKRKKRGYKLIIK